MTSNTTNHDKQASKRWFFIGSAFFDKPLTEDEARKIVEERMFQNTTGEVDEFSFTPVPDEYVNLAKRVLGL